MSTKRQRTGENDEKNGTYPDPPFTPFPHFGTDAIHAGQDPEQWASNAVVPLISLSTTFKQESPGVMPGGYEYSRGGNPTRTVLEKCVAAIEGAKHALAFSSGLGATTAICHLLKMGDHLIAMDDIYGGTNRYFQKVLSKFGVKVTFVDARYPEKVAAAMQENTKLVWVETPTNPTLKLVDIAAVSAIAHQQPDCIVVADNTFSSPYFQRGLDFGADIVMYSATKYMNGHSDVVMGLVACNDDELHKKLHFQLYAAGSCPSPFDCFLVNRGLKTLHVRMRQHYKSGIAVARYLESNPRVRKVIYPGLPSHPQHDIFKKQMKGFGGMVTFYLKGDLENSKTFLQSVKVFTLAESLGGYESLAELPGVMTHASVPPEQRKELGIDNSLIRLSVGLEDTEDIIQDLEQALKKAVPE
ncbi:cystathionine gamma-lyase [Strongylocentrotus purpuratus]|uniref:cystathionine gamma-lyase n=1 Tax=Strongylocentrotus purpuratus TaxID=7668 RepID=A0A7M7T3P0_STRPU|nr:cystathionine gamma-lyase [Strongylocentrotus purpuratus]